MKSSWRIGRVAGIGIYLHATFPLLLLWIGFVAWTRHGHAAAVLTALGLILLLFGIVVLHELGHALMARRFGIGTRDITLLPIGGVARLERMPERAREELLIALAGPAVNATLALLALGLAAASGAPALPPPLATIEHDLVSWLFWVNALLTVFNMLPAFPMDGGRVLRALLAFRLDHVRATTIAAAIGRGFAVALGFLGLAGQPILLLIAVFVWFGAGAEAQATRTRSVLRGVRMHEVMMTTFDTLEPGTPLSAAVELTLASGQQDFPVLADGEMTGLLSQADLVAGLARSGATSPVAEAMRRKFIRAGPEDLVARVVERCKDRSSAVIPVFADDRLVGLVTPENLAEFLMFQTAAASHDRAEAIPPPLGVATPRA